MSASGAVKYMALPGFIPRIFALFSTGFGQIAFLIALIYQSLRLLPAGHPYGDPRNIGRFGIRHVLIEASNGLVFSRKNIDQIVIYFTVLGGLLIFVAQFALLILALIVQQPALAQTFTELFKVNGATPAQDYAFIILDHVFGVRGIFGSCVDPLVAVCQNLRGNNLPASSAFPAPFHIAFHALLRFYSYGIFMVAVFVIIYFAVAVTVETAMTGSPFGQRFNKTWAPVRLIMFFALLVPLNSGAHPASIEGSKAGLNGAQLMTLWAAKGGSNFATNAWRQFNDVITDTYLGPPEGLIARPTVPNVAPLLQFIFTAKTCKMAEEAAHGIDVQAYLVRSDLDRGVVPGGDDALDFRLTGFNDALRHANYGSITVRFGERDPYFNDPIGDNDVSSEHDSFRSDVFPHCGEIVIPITLLDGITPDPTVSATAPGSYSLQEFYYVLVQHLWNDSLPRPGMANIMGPRAECLVRTSYQPIYDPSCNDGVAPDFIPDHAFGETMATQIQEYMNIAIDGYVTRQVDYNAWDPTPVLQSKGWAGAAIWYNRIAQLNGDFATALYSIPKPTRYPYLMEHVAKKRRMQNPNISPQEAYDPMLGADEDVDYPPAVGSIKPATYEQIAPAMSKAFFFWDNGKFFETHYTSKTGNAFIDIVNGIFGTSGIFDMASNTDVHPLAQLSALGKGMMEASIRNVAYGLPGELFAKALPDFTREITEASAGYLKLLGTTTMAMSFMMFYVLPSLPFIYFLFAVSAWVKSIFEAIVAMPLWALAHIVRMDGEGLPGPAATNGYFLLLEIFLRPILIVFGMLASIAIFSALVEIMNDVFSLVISNATGFNREGDAVRVAGGLTSMINFVRSPVDQFFFTAMYVIICYLLGISCFKLIDLVPNNILRWAGVSVATFKEGAGDPAGDVMSKTYKGGMIASGQIKGGALAALS